MVCQGQMQLLGRGEIWLLTKRQQPPVLPRVAHARWARAGGRHPGSPGDLAQPPGLGRSRGQSWLMTPAGQFRGRIQGPCIGHILPEPVSPRQVL